MGDPYLPKDEIQDQAVKTVRGMLSDLIDKCDLIMFHHSLKQDPNPVSLDGRAMNF